MPQNQEVRLPAAIGERLLEIADYQRPYAWERKQLEDLWEDLDLLGPTRMHYAGTLVLRAVVLPNGSVKESMSDDGTTLQHCEVVDGQQRLTTCLVLLDRTRRRLLELEAGGYGLAGVVARKLRDTYGMASVNGALVPKLRLGSGLNDYWVNVVLGNQHHVGPKLLAGQERLKEATAYYDVKLDRLTENVDPQVRFERLNELQRRITAGLGFLVYEVQSIADVGVIFETLNERGRPLTELEKTKNYLLYLSGSIPDARSDQLAKEINEAWSAIFTNLAGEARGTDDQLLRAHWLSTQSPDTRAWKRIDSIKARFDRSRYVSAKTRLMPPVRGVADQEKAWDQLFADVGAYVRSLRNCSFFLSEMFDPQADFDSFTSESERVRRRSAALRRSGVVALYRPLLFAARLRYPTDGTLYADLVDICERYSARVFVIEQRRANAGESRLLRLAHELHNGTDPQRILEQLRAVMWRYASDDSVRATVESTQQNWYGRRGHKYFLYEYELSLMSPHEELPLLSFFTDAAKEQRTTEHILPQHPNDDAACWWNHFTRQEHGNLVHALGNLALTYDNSAYSNKCFRAKRGEPLAPGKIAQTCYAQGKLHQEQRLALHAEWTPESIRQRQQELADWALQRWAVASPRIADAVDEDIEIESEGTEEDDVTLAAASPAPAETG